MEVAAQHQHLDCLFLVFLAHTAYTAFTATLTLKIFAWSSSYLWRSITWKWQGHIGLFRQISSVGHVRQVATPRSVFWMIWKDGAFAFIQTLWALWGFLWASAVTIHFDTNFDKGIRISNETFPPKQSSSYFHCTVLMSKMALYCPQGGGTLRHCY